MLTLLGIAFLDPSVARWVAQTPAWMLVAFRQGTTVLEVVFGFPVSKFALGFVLLIAAAVFMRRRRPLALVLLYVGATHLTARLAAGMLKNVFGRERPFEALPDYEGAFFVDGSSFPSGHAAHFWSLFFPLALLFPRYRLPLLVLPLFVSVARVAVGDHFLSDVIASAALSALVAWGFAYIFRMPRDERIEAVPVASKEAVTEEA